MLCMINTKPDGGSSIRSAIPIVHILFAILPDLKFLTSQVFV
jgi:hypothetical protein